jgi:hypothetical protein
MGRRGELSKLGQEGRSLVREGDENLAVVHRPSFLNAYKGSHLCVDMFEEDLPLPWGKD